MKNIGKLEVIIIFLVFLNIILLIQPYSLYNVQGYSMEPEYESGDIVVAKDTLDLSVGEVIIYEKRNNLIIHRIIDIKDNRYITKGDNNTFRDPPVRKQQIKGEVVYKIK